MPTEETEELLTWDPEDGTDEDEEECEDELPADLEFAGDVSEDGDDAGTEPVSLSEVDLDGYAKKPLEIPQPDRARSHPDLPKVKSSSFKRLIR